MAAAGIGDIFVPNNILGRDKLERLAALRGRVAISLTANHSAVGGMPRRSRRRRPLRSRRGVG